jgi:hypothetical protein
MDLLIDSHCHLIRSTRALVPWGTTLAVAVDCLDAAPVDLVCEHLSRVAASGLSGEEEHHLGAPKGLNDTASKIAAKVAGVAAGVRPPALSQIYLAALEQLTRTDPAKVCAAYGRRKTCPS